MSHPPCRTSTPYIHDTTPSFHPANTVSTARTNTSPPITPWPTSSRASSPQSRQRSTAKPTHTHASLKHTSRIRSVAQATRFSHTPRSPTDTTRDETPAAEPDAGGSRPTLARWWSQRLDSCSQRCCWCVRCSAMSSNPEGGVAMCVGGRRSHLPLASGRW